MIHFPVMTTLETSIVVIDDGWAIDGKRERLAQRDLFGVLAKAKALRRVIH